MGRFRKERSLKGGWATGPFVVRGNAHVLLLLERFGWAGIVSGTFSATEIAMTLIVGLASIVGIAGVLAMKSGVRAWPPTAVILLVFVL